MGNLQSENLKDENLSLAAIEEYIDNMAKPPHSLAKLENVAARICFITQSLNPVTSPRKITLFVGDHGVTEEQVTPWPSELTTMMMRTILAGKSSSAVLAKQNHANLTLIDVGSKLPLSDLEYETAINARIGAGTKNLATGAAMSVEEFGHAFKVGEDAAISDFENGYKVIIAGEMGIGNTTPAAALTALICGVDAQKTTGGGAGAQGEMLERKMRIICDAVEREKAVFNHNPKQAIAALCGFEIAAMAGYYKKGAELGLVVLLDGYIATAAALIAECLFAGSKKNFIAAHRSQEQGHIIALNYLDCEPILEWNMRLGEGTGALIALPMLDNAAALMTMAQLSDVMA